MQGPPGQPPFNGPPFGGGGGGYGPPQGGGGGYGPPQGGGGGYGPPQGGGGGYGPPQGGYPPQGAPPQGYGGGFGPQGGPPQFGQAPGGRAPVTRMSGGLYIALYVLSMCSVYGLAGLGSNTATQEAGMALPLPVLVAGITMMIFLYKMWSAINDGQTKPTPGAAVGLLFVPIFSIYWVFVAWPGYASRYNAYTQRHGIRAPQLSMGLLLCSILFAGFPLIGTILMCITISKIASAVNALSAPGT